MSHLESDDTTLPGPASGEASEVTPKTLALVLAWSTTEPQRAGEVAVLTPDTDIAVLGRGAGDGKQPRVAFAPLRPGRSSGAAPLAGKTLSRNQLEIRPTATELVIASVGRARTYHNGDACEACTVVPGDTLRIGAELLLLCVARPVVVKEPRFFAQADGADFGRADPYGIVGESLAAWDLRDQLAFGALSDAHVLIHGESGVGKELAARAVHAMSVRSKKALVARNASTLPAGIAAAELFGNRRDYPNAGTPDRVGLVGEADGGTLFLDELGELPHDLQTQLLRFLDAGEYQRIGESKTRRADLRFIGATNRQPGELRSDLFARFKVRAKLPDLNARRQDVPLLCRHLVAQAADKSPQLAARFVRDTPRGVELRMSAGLADALVRHHYNLHVRELDALLWSSMSESPEDVLELTPRVIEGLAASTPPPSSAKRVEGSPSKEEIREALRLEGGSRTKAAKRLNLASRFVLYRLMKTHGIADE